MPLHGKREIPGAVHAETLDQAVVSDRLYGNSIGKPGNALRVQRIHCNSVRACEVAQQAAFEQMDLMRRTILDIERVVRIFLVAVVSLDFMDVLVQRASKHHVQLLESPANCKHRHSLFERQFYQRQRCFVAVRIMQRTRSACRSVIMMWFDIRRASRQQNSINSLQHCFDVDTVPESRDEKRYRIGAIPDRGCVLLSNHVKGMRIDLTPVGGNSYNWFRTHTICAAVINYPQGLRNNSVKRSVFPVTVARPTS